ncbi:RES family NAD+ phosphorylase [Devosia sp. ZB163]|uniref:RES family NAD+ phosphorylase n=1 Tax=Devosia sp. ZB163 TaxID=3025938 RepID=UPI0023613455|nr:RES family NAD+ phosphorylase [Devosia sp. ZB163]MDC9826418.1 RES family NAD+ phosphorylase [Devosia sp. ZB163]
MMRSPAPQPTHRLIPSRFPPIGLFDTVATVADLEAVMELAEWTNDRLVKERVARLPQSEWVFGRTNSSVVMAAFLHAAPGGARFNGPDLGAWYAAASTVTAIAEVGHHLRREALARGLEGASRTFRSYMARLDGDYRDIRGSEPELHAADSYAAGQSYGETLRATGEDGILYDSVRHRGGTNACAYRPSKVLDVVQAEHFEVSVIVTEKRIEAKQLP